MLDIVRPDHDPVEFVPEGRTYVIRTWRERGKGPMPSVRNLILPQQRRLTEKHGNGCLVPVPDLRERPLDPADLSDGDRRMRGDMWIVVPDQPMFPVAGCRQQTEGAACNTVTCDPNELVAPIHPKQWCPSCTRPTGTARWPAATTKTARSSGTDPAKRMTVRGPVFPTGLAQTASWPLPGLYKSGRIEGIGRGRRFRAAYHREHLVFVEGRRHVLSG